MRAVPSTLAFPVPATPNDGRLQQSRVLHYLFLTMVGARDKAKALLPCYTICVELREKGIDKRR